MKKTILKKFVLVFSFFALVSCSDSDENVSYNKSDLLGQWSLSNYNYDGSFEISGGPVSIPNATFTGEGINMNSTTNFTENPNKATSSGSYDIKLNSTANGQTVTETYKIDNVSSEANWELNNDVLTLKNGELIDANLPDEIKSFVNVQDGDFKIIELTSNSLKLRKAIDQDFSQGGITVKTTINIAIDFTK